MLSTPKPAMSGQNGTFQFLIPVGSGKQVVVLTIVVVLVVVDAYTGHVDMLACQVRMSPFSL